MAEVLAEVADALKNGDGVVLARIVSDRGSTPRSAGARMIIMRGGAIAGTVGGGLSESVVMERAREAFASESAFVYALDMNGSDAAGEDMICGGNLEVLIEYVPSDPETIAVFERVKAEHAKLHRVALATELAESGGGIAVRRRFVPEGRLFEAARAVTGSALVNVDGGKFAIDVIESAAWVYIFGAGHVGREVAALASHVGFHVVVADDRAEFANAERFPATADVRVLGSFTGCCDGLAIDGFASVVIVTRGHAHDKTVLGQVLRTGAGYIGMIGSRKKRDAIYKALRAEGFGDDDLGRVRCPIGLAIPTETPEEIAVSIVGELIERRAKNRDGRE